MSALQQYIDLYDQHSGLIDSHSARPLNDLRRHAAEILRNSSLPREGTDNYENVNLEKMLAPDYGLNIAKIDIDVNPDASFQCNIPTLSRGIFMLVNDTFAHTDTAYDNLPKGVEIGSLRSFALNYPHLVEKYYGKIADMKNPVVALDSMLAQDGFFMRVKKGVKIDRPIQLINILQNGAPLMAVRRLLIVIEEDAEAKLLVCDHTQNPDTDMLALETVEIFVEDNAKFDYYNIEESSRRTSRISTLFLSQCADSEVVIDAITLFNGTTRNEYYCDFKGKHASLRLLGMGIEDEQRRISTYSGINHNVPECKSDELFKFTVADESRAAFTGRIYVAPGASLTEAYQSNRNLVEGSSARIESKPQLEIYNDDVKCSHGSATGQLDALQLFYMRTRGIDEANAKLLLKQAFMADIIDAVRVENLRDRLHRLVELRFAGADSACASCAACTGRDD